MKDWKTTLSGAVAAIILAIQGAQGHDLKTVGLAIVVGLLGYFAKDGV